MRKISTLAKMTVCLTAGLVCAACFFRIGKRFLLDWLSFQAVVALTLLLFLTALVYGIVWSFKRSSGSQSSDTRSSAILGFWQGAIRYGIAMNLTMIGLQKFFHLQISTHLGALDLPFSSFQPEDLAWAFFAHSRAFICIIGGLQVFGSLLLLFSRTRLAGVFVLLPVMLNIVVLNACYHFEAGESIVALVLLAGLIYLLLSEYPRLVEFFFRAKTGLPALGIKPSLKNLLRLSVLLIPLFLIWHYGPPDQNPWLTGKYKVSRLQVNHRDQAAASCADSLLTLVYLDRGNECMFEYNSQQRRLYGVYHLDGHHANGQTQPPAGDPTIPAGAPGITIAWHYPAYIHDTLVGQLSTINDREKRIAGVMGRDTIEIDLLKSGQ